MSGRTLAFANKKTPPDTAPSVQPCLSNFLKTPTVLLLANCALGGDSKIKASNFSTSVIRPSVSNDTFALAFTLCASSEYNFHSKLLVFEISFDALKGSITDVRQAIGKPSKIKNPIR